MSFCDDILDRMNSIVNEIKNINTSPVTKNLRKTKARKEILTILSKHKDRSFSAEELHIACEHRLQTDLSTVYRTMHTLIELGLVTKTMHPDGKAYFQLASPQGETHHHRIICTRCKTSADIHLCPLHDIEEKITSETGFEITAHSIELTGICPACKAKTETCTIRTATMADLNEIELLIHAVKEKMRADGNPQWDDTYPARSDFIKDIEDQALYAAYIDGKIAGIVTLNDDEYVGYNGVAWQSSKPYKILHRLAVHPCRQRKNVARLLMEYVEAEAKQKGLAAIRSDTFSLNAVMQHFFEKCGYKRSGSIYMRGKSEPFYCFEKIL